MKRELTYLLELAWVLNSIEYVNARLWHDVEMVVWEHIQLLTYLRGFQDINDNLYQWFAALTIPGVVNQWVPPDLRTLFCSPTVFFLVCISVQRLTLGSLTLNMHAWSFRHFINRTENFVVKGQIRVRTGWLLAIPYAIWTYILLFYLQFNFDLYMKTTLAVISTLFLHMSV